MICAFRWLGLLDCSMCCSASLFWAESWKFHSRILEMIQRYPSLCIPRLWQYRHLVCNQVASIIDRKWHTGLPMLGINKRSSYMLACCKLKHSTHKIITGHYIITLACAFGQTIEVGYSPPSFIMNCYLYSE